jgi:hypothetical protein
VRRSGEGPSPCPSPRQRAGRGNVSARAINRVCRVLLVTLPVSLFPLAGKGPG